jgi:hypothetical protein
LNYLIAGLAKSGTTILFSRLKQAITPGSETFFEPDRDEQLKEILEAGAAGHTLTKVLIGRVTSKNHLLEQFDRHIVIYRDPRDQFISMLLYLFYDFQVNGDHAGYQEALEALARKVQDPAGHSTIDLYNLVAGLVSRAPIAVFGNLHREQRAYIDAFSPHLLRYEDFIDERLQPAEKYLALDLHNDAQVPDIYTRVARSKAYGDWRHWLNEQDIDYIDKAWGDTIQSLGYSLQNTGKELSIPVSTSIDYVRRFDPSRRQDDSAPESH